ncbi:DUF2188 domain-containing protein [Mycoplasmopsis hyopharyngis]|uniref:DUF2188 domain-containing protein n=1 Tax=Mycoplasmopsis hyopharyngis TaxID=29558 RepID=UPI003873C138
MNAETEKKPLTIWHITPKGKKWQLKGVGRERATKIFDTQKEAIDFAKIMVKNNEGTYLVHKATGPIRVGQSYKPKKTAATKKNKTTTTKK